MNPDILTAPSSTLMSRRPIVDWFKGAVKMSEFFVGACNLVAGKVLNLSPPATPALFGHWYYPRTVTPSYRNQTGLIK